MKSSPIAFIALIGALVFVNGAFADCRISPPSTLYLVRHAEKVEPDGPLTAEGWRMAADLVVALKDQPISRIYTTKIPRSQQTAMPLATFMNLKPREIRKKNQSKLIREICDRSSGKVVIVVAHSDTIPIILTDLQIDEARINKLRLSEERDIKYCDLVEITFGDNERVKKKSFSENAQCTNQD